MIEIRNIIQRLRDGQSKRQIHRDLRVHRSIVRQLGNLAISEGWLNSDLPMPSDGEITKAWSTSKKNSQPHRLDPYKKEIKQWHE